MGSSQSAKQASNSQSSRRQKQPGSRRAGSARGQANSRHLCFDDLVGRGAHAQSSLRRRRCRCRPGRPCGSRAPPCATLNPLARHCSTQRRHCCSFRFCKKRCPAQLEGHFPENIGSWEINKRQPWSQENDLAPAVLPLPGPLLPLAVVSCRLSDGRALVRTSPFARRRQEGTRAAHLAENAENAR
jgi:hypothetical protein